MKPLSLGSLLMMAALLLNACKKDKVNELKADKTNIEVTPTGAKETIRISSNTEWTLAVPSEAVSWISANKTGGSGPADVELTVSANPGTDPRSATLTVKSSSNEIAPISITVRQGQPDIVINGFPEHAKGGEIIAITGSGFSAIKTKNKVTINGKDAQVMEADFNSLKVEVPLKAGDGKITVAVEGKTSTSVTNLKYDWIWVEVPITFNSPLPSGEIWDLALDPSGIMYLQYRDNGFIQKVVFKQDGTADNTKFFESTSTFPVGTWSIYLDKDQNLLLPTGPTGVARINKEGSITALPVTVPSGDYFVPYGITADKNGNIFFSYVPNPARIWKLSPDGKLSDYATATLNYPLGMATDNNGNVYVSNIDGYSITRITPKADGTGSPQIWATGFNEAIHICTSKNGNVYVADSKRNAILKVVNGEDGLGVVTTVVQNVYPYAVAVNETEDVIYVADRFRKLMRFKLQ